MKALWTRTRGLLASRLPIATRLAAERLHKLDKVDARPREHLPFWDFICQAWDKVEPQKMVPAEHMRAIARACELVLHHMRPHLKVLDRDPRVPDASLQEVLVNIPPGQSKSLLLCVLFPAWAWSRDPTIKFIFASNDADLSLRDAERTKQLLTSSWFVARWGDVRRPHATWTKRYYVNRFGGSRLSTSIGGRVIGNHADCRIVDDPTKPQDLLLSKESVHERLNRTVAFVETTLATRITDPKRATLIVVMQRLHQNDLAGHMLRTVDRRPSFRHLRFAMEYRASRDPQPYEWPDHRTIEGEILTPRYGPREVEQLKKDIGSLGQVSAQLDQEPIPDQGLLFQRAHFKRAAIPYDLRNKALWIQSWDMRFKDDAETGDYVVGQVWARHGVDFYLIDEVRGRFSFVESCQAMTELSKKWPRAKGKIIENKANGPAVASTLKNKVGGVVLVEPQGGKMARAHSISAYVVAGNVHIPPDTQYDEWLDEITAFPKARFDDRVDAFSQALIYLDDKNKTRYGAMYAGFGR